MEHRQHIVFDDMYNNYKIIQYAYYQPTNINRYGLHYLDIQKTIIINNYTKFVFKIHLNNISFTKYNKDKFMLSIVKVVDIFANHTIEFPSILIKIQNPKEVQKYVEFDCKNLKIDKLKGLFDNIDIVINKFLQLYKQPYILS